MTAIVPNLPADQYHADLVADVPTLSASIAAVIVEKSPAHARELHPKLNPGFKEAKPKDEWDIGTAAHALLLQGEDIAYVVEGYDNWKTNAAKAERDEARERGQIPMLRAQYEEVAAMVDVAREWIKNESQAYPPLLDAGRAEVPLVWTDKQTGVVCRSRLDWLRDDLTAIDDYKTSQSANQRWFSERGIYQNGYEVKCAFYLRAVRALAAQGTRPIETTFRWIVQEKKPPYAISSVTPGPDVLALADDKVDTALRIWKRCLAENRWPAYDPRVATAELPPFEEIKWLERSAAA